MPSPPPQPPGSSTSTARDYYNSPSSDNFYYTIWGGEDIHIGIYTSPSDTIKAASQRTVERLAALSSITSSTRVLDLGAGYGGGARWLARTYGCKVTCLNLSEVQNERNRVMSKEQGLGELIEVVDGAFERLPFEEGSFDLVWSQDSFLHSNEQEAIVQEISKVLVREGGNVVFTNIMAAEDADPERMVPIKKRLSLESDLATTRFYSTEFAKHGFEDAGFVNETEHLVTHYSRVMAALSDAAGADGGASGISEEFVENAKTGLRHWVDGGNDGQLEWGIFHFRR